MENNESEFVERVMQRVFSCCLEISSQDQDSLRHSAVRMFRGGMTEEDAATILRNTEEANPDIPEDVALRRMHAVYAKYPHFQNVI